MFTWPYPPNWSAKVEETLRFKTEIIQSRQGQEQRVATRFEPRVELNFDVLVRRDGLRQFTQDIYRNVRSEIIMPFWPAAVQTTNLNPIGSTSIQVTQAEPWMVAGAWTSIGSDGTAESHRIASGSGTTINLVTGLAQARRVASWCAEGWPGRLSGTMDTNGPTSEVSTATIDFAATPGALPVTPLGTGSVLLDGLEVFDFPMNWSSGIRTNLEDFREVLDEGTGIIDFLYPVTALAITRRFTMIRKDRTLARKMEEFFRRMRGMQREFYYANPQSDLVAVTGIASGASTITVAGANVAAYLNDDPVHRAIAVPTALGTVYNQVTSATALGNTTILYLRDPWPYTVAVGGIKRVSLLNRSRFASDVLTVEWLTSTVASVSGAVRTLEDDWS
jgi:hypothetical protein